MSQLAELDLAGDEELRVASISGQIDMSNARAIGNAIADATGNEALGLIVDLSGVKYMDSSGVSMLADLARRLSRRDQRLAVIASEETRARRVLSLAGAEALVPLHETLASARGDFARPDAQA